MIIYMDIKIIIDYDRSSVIENGSEIVLKF